MLSGAIITAKILMSSPVIACVSTPEPRCWTERAIYAAPLAPREAPMPVPSPWGKP